MLKMRATKETSWIKLLLVLSSTLKVCSEIWIC